jgi:hypothetical protein
MDVDCSLIGGHVRRVCAHLANGVVSPGEARHGCAFFQRDNDGQRWWVVERDLLCVMDGFEGRRVRVSVEYLIITFGSVVLVRVMCDVL